MLIAVIFILTWLFNFLPLILCCGESLNSERRVRTRHDQFELDSGVFLFRFILNYIWFVQKVRPYALDNIHTFSHDVDFIIYFAFIFSSIVLAQIQNNLYVVFFVPDLPATKRKTPAAKKKRQLKSRGLLKRLGLLRSWKLRKTRRLRGGQSAIRGGNGSCNQPRLYTPYFVRRHSLGVWFILS